MSSSQPKSARSKLIWAAVILVALTVAGLAGLRLWRGPKVAVSTVKRGVIVRSLVSSGRVLAAGRATLGATVPGMVKSILAREGQRVRRGEVLAELDRQELTATVEQARANVKQSAERISEISRLTQPVADQAQRQLALALDRAETDWQRAQAMFKTGAISAKDRDTAQYNVELARSQLRSSKTQAEATGSGGVARQQAQASYEAATAALRAAEARLAQSRIMAPADGVILERKVEPGDVVAAGRALFIFQSDYQTTLTIQPDEKALPDLKLGQKAIATADAYPSVRFDAQVSYIAPAVDPERATVEIRLSVANPPPFLIPDMTVSVDLEVGRQPDGLAVVATDVREPYSPTPWVLVLERGHATKKPVKLGLRGRDLIEILDGVRAGEIVVRGSENLKDGERGHAVEPKS